MCGIAGIVRFDSQPVAPSLLRDMCCRLRHRGPDDAGWSVFDRAGLANTRLKIIDLSPAGHQPIFNEDGSIAVVLNGEIYNFQDLRSELARRGHLFRSATDTEVIVHLYEDLGPECISRLDGMFALAIWDQRKRELLLARDRSGKKPLYYHADSHAFTFASEIKALFASPDTPRRIDSSCLPIYLALGYVPCPYSMYEGIRQVEPASMLLITAGGAPRARRYWDLNFSTSSMTWSSAKDRLRTLVTEAVRKRMVADVPLGAFLSGGLDSSIVVATMSKLNMGPVRTFSIGFEGDSRFDERRYARAVAEHYRTQHQEFVVGSQSVSLIETLVRAHDQPFMDSSAIPTYLVSKMAREHVTVVLTGDGGDEVFAGYHRFPLSLLLERLPAALLRTIQVAAGLVRPVSRRASDRLSRIAATGQVDPMLRMWAVFPLFATGLWRAASADGDANAVLRHARELVDSARSVSPLSRLLYCNFKDYLVNDLHVKVDRCTMASSLEARSPMLDTDLMEFAASLPDSMKLHRTRGKHILRETFRDALPPAVLRRGKMGFGVPLAWWFRLELRDYVHDMLADSSARVYDYLDREPVRGLVDDFLAGQDFCADALWSLLTLETWLRAESSANARRFAHLASSKHN